MHTTGGSICPPVRRCSSVCSSGGAGPGGAWLWGEVKRRAAGGAGGTGQGRLARAQLSETEPSGAERGSRVEFSQSAAGCRWAGVSREL